MIKITRIYKKWSTLTLYGAEHPSENIEVLLNNLEFIEEDTIFFFDLVGRNMFVINKVDGKNIPVLTYWNQWNSHFARLLFEEMVGALEASAKLEDICD